MEKKVVFILFLSSTFNINNKQDFDRPGLSFDESICLIICPYVLSCLLLCTYEPITLKTYLYAFQDGSPSDRKIVKLCEYAAKNPFRLPKVLIPIISLMYLAKLETIRIRK